VTSFAVKHGVHVMTPTEARVATLDARRAGLRSHGVLLNADRAIRDAREVTSTLHEHWQRLYEERERNRREAGE
jgi:hypothetical protein